jgi:hypothetical protein
MIRRKSSPEEADQDPVMHLRSLDGGMMEVTTTGRPESIIFWLNVLMNAMNAIASDTEDQSGLVEQILANVGRKE